MNWMCNSNFCCFLYIKYTHANSENKTRLFIFLFSGKYKLFSCGLFKKMRREFGFCFVFLLQQQPNGFNLDTLLSVWIQ